MLTIYFETGDLFLPEGWREAEEASYFYAGQDDWPLHRALTHPDQELVQRVKTIYHAMVDIELPPNIEPGYLYLG